MGKVLFAGGRLDSGTIVGTVTEVTTAGYFDSSYADCCLQISGSPANYFTAPFTDLSNAPVDVVTGETLYCHFEVRMPTASTAAPGTILWYAVNAAGQPWLAIRSTSTTAQYALYYNSGTGGSPAWTQLGSNFTWSIGTTYTIDVKLTLGSPHSIEFFMGNASQFSTTFTQASLTALRAMQFYGFNGGNTANWSQKMATEGISTVGGKVGYSRPTGAGANTGWGGAHTNVNEAIDSTATADTSSTAGQDQTYAMGDVTVPGGLVIASVFHGIRGKNAGAAPANIKSLLRTGGTNYPASANIPGIGAGYAGLLQRWDTDPATSAAWTQSGFNAYEAGYRSAT